MLYYITLRASVFCNSQSLVYWERRKKTKLTNQEDIKLTGCESVLT